jgi:hypothetical protein
MRLTFLDILSLSRVSWCGIEFLVLYSGSSRFEFWPGRPQLRVFGPSTIAPFNTQNVMETGLAKLYYFEAAEFENDEKIFSLALVFELQLWPEMLLF